MRWESKYWGNFPESIPIKLWPAVVQWVDDGNVAIHGDGYEVPDGSATGQDDEEEAQEAPNLNFSQGWTHIEGQMVG